MNRYVPFGVVAVAWMLLPLLVQGDATLSLIVFAAISLILCVGLSLLFGYAGQVSLGQAGFYGIGAYVAGGLSTRTAVPTVVDLLAAVLVPAAVGYAVARPVLRLRGYTLAMVTAALGLILHTVFVEWSDVTGGYSGLTNIPPLALGTFVGHTPLSMYYVVGGFALLVLLLSLRMIETPYGRAMRTMRESEPAARSVGIEIPRLKAEVFALAAGLSGLAGALYAHFVGFISPESFSVDASVNLLLAVVIGGVGSPWGAAIGAVLITLLPEWLHDLQSAYGLVFGLIVIVLLTIEPQGIVGLVRRLGSSRSVPSSRAGQQA
jgi:branched-chain amino acid transport system permease protein